MTPIPVIDWQMMRDFALLAPHIKPTTGNIFFVHATNGNAANTGISSTAPMATIDQAINLCTANHGDIVVAMPGHTETLTTATQLVMDVAGIQIVGLGQGLTRPVITFSAVGANIPVSAANCRISNIVFSAGIASVVSAITVTGLQFELDNCKFWFGATTFSFVTQVTATVVGANYLYVHDNNFVTEIGSATSVNGVLMTALVQPIILRNRFYGTWSGAPIIVATTLCSQVDIGENLVFNSDVSQYNGIDLGAVNTTGNVYRNYVTAMYASAHVTGVSRLATATWANNFQANVVSLRAASVGFPATSVTQ